MSTRKQSIQHGVQFQIWPSFLIQSENTYQLQDTSGCKICFRSIEQLFQFSRPSGLYFRRVLFKDFFIPFSWSRQTRKCYIESLIHLDDRGFITIYFTLFQFKAVIPLKLEREGRRDRNTAEKIFSISHMFNLASPNFFQLKICLQDNSTERAAGSMKRQNKKTLSTNHYKDQIYALKSSANQNELLKTLSMH